MRSTEGSSKAAFKPLLTVFFFLLLLVVLWLVVLFHEWGSVLNGINSNRIREVPFADATNGPQTVDVMTPAWTHPKVTECPFQKNATPLLKPELDQSMDRTLAYFNSLPQLTYVLWDGSALGALRHFGKIPNDGDIDLIIPVWLNAKLIRFAVAKYPNDNSPDKCISDQMSAGFKENTQIVADLRSGKNELRFCGWTRDQWVDAALGWLQAVGSQTPHGTEVSFEKSEWGGIRLWLYNYGVDVIVSISDHKFSVGLNQSTAHPICKCKMGLSKSLCFTLSHRFMRERYGDDYLTPDRSMSINKPYNMNYSVAPF